MKIIKRGINAVIPFLLANVYLLARCPEWNIPLMPLIVVVFIAVYVLLTAMPLLGLKNIQSKGIRRCRGDARICILSWRQRSCLWLC